MAPAAEEAGAVDAAHPGVAVGGRRGLVAQEAVDAVERAVVLVLRRRAPHLEEEGEEILAERDHRVGAICRWDLLEVAALHVLPPAGAREVGRLDADEEAPRRLGVVSVVRIRLALDEQEGQLGVEEAVRPAHVDAADVELRRLRVLGEGAAVVVDGQIRELPQGVLELDPAHLVHLAEGLVEEEGEDVQFEEAGIEAEGGEDAGQDAAPVQLVREGL